MALFLPPSTCMDEKEMYARQFPSWESFCSFFDAWCEQQCAVFYMRNSILLMKCRWSSLMRPEAVVALKYRHVRLLCKHGAPEKNLGLRLQKDLCEASVNVGLNEKKDQLIISRCRLKHNHELSPLEFAHYFKKGYLLANSCLPVRITNKMSKQFLVMEDIQRLVSKCKTEENGLLDVLKAMESLFVHDPGAKVRIVFVEDQPMVRTVFFITSLMRSLCQRFPAMLVFDRMVGLDEEFDLYVLLCVDSDGQGQECAYCLSRKGTLDLLRFTLVSLVQSVPEVKQEVRCVTVGLEIWDQKAVEELLPNAQVQIGRPQETLFSKAQEMGAPEDERMWPLLGDLASASYLKAYTRTVKKMETIFPKNFMEYFQEHWHKRRKMWVDLWAFKAAQNISASELIRRHQQQLVYSLSPSPSLAQGILDLVALQTAKAKDLNDEEVAIMYHSFYNAEQVKLIKQELAFARKGTFNVQGTTDGFSLNDGQSEFCMDQKLTSCNCSIFTTSCVPCRHLFTTRVRTGEALFDSSLLQKNRVVHR